MRLCANSSCQQCVSRSSSGLITVHRRWRPETGCAPSWEEAPLDSGSRSPNGFLSALTADDFELVRPHLRTVELAQALVLGAVGDTLRRAYLPHRGVISL